MEEREKDTSTDIGETMVSQNHEFEFVVVENSVANDEARVEPASNTDGNNENWEDDATNNNNVAAEVNPFPLNMNSELDYPNVEQLTVEPISGAENAGVCMHSSELYSDLQNNRRGFLQFYFTIENVAAFFSRQNKAMSDVFKCRDMSFRLIVQHNRGHSIDTYILRARTDDEQNDYGWDVVASCDISLVDPVTGLNYITKSFGNHTFTAGSDWGFCDFVQYRTLHPAMLQENFIKFCVVVKADPPFCYSIKSKALTGHVGIRNQGATCYMNSLLQVLFFLDKFRTTCYRIPTEMDDDSSMALSLQKVFYNLQYSDTAVCTVALTKSFGWSAVEVLMQHDVQEMMRVLIEKIESRMRNTLLEPILPSIIQGRFVSYVKCRDIEFSSQREEVFYDIQLSLENAGNVYDSFKRYVSPEMMDDDNKYHAGTHGLQAAEKGTLFITLPPVLFLHLLRFQFDAETNQVLKNNNLYEFYKNIDLTEFVRDDDDQTSWKYTLFAVLSHNGNGAQGHYVAFINPSLKDQWLKFDDDIISMVHEYDAIESNYGSKIDLDEWMKSYHFNAYMLVYVRDSATTEIFEETDPKFITEELKGAVMRDLDEINSYNTFNRHHFTTDVYLYTNIEYSLAYARDVRPIRMPKLSVTRDMTIDAFKEEVLTAFNLDRTKQLRIWPIVHAAGNLTYPVYINDTDLLIPTVSDFRLKYSNFISVWVELALPGLELPPFDPNQNVLVFYGYYSATECRQLYVDHGYHDKDANISELVPVLNRLMEWSPSRELNIYQVLRGTKITELNCTDGSTFSDYVQPERNTMIMRIVFEAKKHDQSNKLNSILLYYQDLLLHATITISNVDQPKSEERIDISLQSTFQQLLETLAGRLNYDKNKIQIFHSYGNGSHRYIPSSSSKTLKVLLTDSHQKFQLFYKLHTTDVSFLETTRNFAFHWLSIDMREEKQFTLYLSGDETLEQILAEAAKIIGSDPTNGSGKYRALFVDENDARIVIDASEIYKHIDEVSENANAGKYCRIEEIPKGDDILNKNERFVPVIPVRAATETKCPPIFVHTPFIFKVNLTDSWKCVQTKLRNRLNLSESIWECYRLSVLLQDDVDDVVVVDETRRLIDCIDSMFSIRMEYIHKLEPIPPSVVNICDATILELWNTLKKSDPK